MILVILDNQNMKKEVTKICNESGTTWSPSPSDLRLWSTLPKSVNFIPCNMYHFLYNYLLVIRKKPQIAFLDNNNNQLNLGGLDSNEVWLSQGDLLVLKGKKDVVWSFPSKEQFLKVRSFQNNFFINEKLWQISALAPKEW